MLMNYGNNIKREAAANGFHDDSGSVWLPQRSLTRGEVAKAVEEAVRPLAHGCFGVRLVGREKDNTKKRLPRIMSIGRQ